MEGTAFHFVGVFNNYADELGKYSELLYIQERDPRAEQWNGYRLGIDGAKAMGFER